MSILLLLKLTIAPLLVAGMSLVARRFGPTVGGLIMGLPWMTGPVLLILAIERGDGYLVEAARGALLAVPPIAIFGLAYAVAARAVTWPLAVAAAAVAFAGSGALFSQLVLPALPVALLGIASLLLARQAIPAPPGPAVALALPWWDIPARMIVTAGLVGLVAMFSDYLGPTLSGIASSYPVILTVVASFTQALWGVPATIALIRGVLLSLIGFAVFFWVVATFAPDLGLVPSYGLAIAAGVAFNATLLLLNRHWQRARAAASTTAG